MVRNMAQPSFESSIHPGGAHAAVPGPNNQLATAARLILTRSFHERLRQPLFAAVDSCFAGV